MGCWTYKISKIIGVVEMKHFSFEITNYILKTPEKQVPLPRIQLIHVPFYKFP